MGLSDELHWIKARSSVGSGACVELAAAGDMIALRNSRDPGVVLHYTKAEIAAFIEAARHGEFDHFVK
jgi:hypothetical protein